MEPTPWKLPHRIYTIEVISMNLHHGSHLMEPTPLKLHDGT